MSAFWTTEDFEWRRSTVVRDLFTADSLDELPGEDVPAAEDDDAFRAETDDEEEFEDDEEEEEDEDLEDDDPEEAS